MFVFTFENTYKLKRQNTLQLEKLICQTEEYLPIVFISFLTFLADKIFATTNQSAIGPKINPNMKRATYGAVAK